MELNKAPPLDGVTVLDLTQFMSGPFATQILGDLGAEVLKVESPDGDLSRSLPPHFIGEDSAYFHSLNRNKESLVFNLKKEQDRARLRDLALKADIIIENFRPGVAARLGLDPDLLLKQRPELIWCSISGFGQDGPYKNLPAYDIIVQAMSGGMSLTGVPGERPVRAGIPIADLSAGLYAVVGVLAALRRKSETGQGEVIDISMLDCQVAMLTYQSAYVLAGGGSPAAQGRGHESIPTYDCFPTSDDTEIVIAANTQRMWADLAVELGLPELVDDPRFLDAQKRNEHRGALQAFLRTAFLTAPSAEWEARLRARSIPVARVASVDEVLADPQVLARGMIEEMESEQGDTVRVSGNPIRFKKSKLTAPRYPPRLDENSRAEERELSLDVAEKNASTSGGEN